MFAVVVTGLPGSGKSTVALPLAQHLGLPLLSKDHIKEVLADALGEGAHRVGAAAVALLYELAKKSPQVVLESFFWPGIAEPDLMALDRPLVQVHCDCAPALARERFERRSAAGHRHPVHHGMDDWERFSDGRGRLDLPGLCLEVDTSGPFDSKAIPALAQELRTALPPN